MDQRGTAHPPDSTHSSGLGSSQYLTPVAYWDIQSPARTLLLIAFMDKWLNHLLDSLTLMRHMGI